MNIQIEESINHFRSAAARYAKNERYYRGNHNLAFASEKFTNTFGSLFREFALNLCPAVCDAVRDRLRITGFSAGHASHFGNAGNADRISAKHESDALVSTIWHRNRMQQRSAEVHREALINGDAYVIVWPDAEGNAEMHPNRAATCSVSYDDERPGHVIRAAKYWRTRGRHTRLNIFFPDRIEKYVSAKPTDGFLPEAREMAPFREGDGGSVVPNPFGVIPVFHFANNADVGAFGRSELEAVIPLQDGLNKSALDLLVAMEFSAFRQRWAAGIDVQRDDDGNAIPPFDAGIDHLWVSGNPDARFGDLGTTDLDQFLKVKDSFRIDIASVSGTPMYYMLPHTRGFPSGEALRKAESRFTAKVRDRQTAFGETWARAMEFALVIEGVRGERLVTNWEDPFETI